MTGFAIGEWMVGCTPSEGKIEVGPWPDRTRWSDKYELTAGCCEMPRLETSPEEQMLCLLRDFHTIVVADGLDPQAVHREFLKIGAYRAWVAPELLPDGEE